MRLGVRTDERRRGGVTRASATLGLRWVDRGRKKHWKTNFCIELTLRLIVN